MKFKARVPDQQFDLKFRLHAAGEGDKEVPLLTAWFTLDPAKQKGGTTGSGEGSPSMQEPRRLNKALNVPHVQQTHQL